MLLCIMCTTEPPIWNIYSWHTLTRRCFSWSCSDKLCVYHHYYKGTSIRRLGHFECCKCFSTPIKGTTTKLLMITMPPKTLSCSSFCMPFKINMNTLCIFYFTLILYLLTGHCSSNLLVASQITILKKSKVPIESLCRAFLVALIDGCFKGNKTGIFV